MNDMAFEGKALCLPLGILGTSRSKESVKIQFPVRLRETRLPARREGETPSFRGAVTHRHQSTPTEAGLRGALSGNLCTSPTPVEGRRLAVRARRQARKSCGGAP